MGRIADSRAERSLLRQPGAIMLVSCYELGHQPLGIAQPIGFLEQAGFAPVGLDIAVDNIDESALRLARFVGISVPMHTALRLGVRVAELIRRINPACHICFYGLYASHQCGIFAPTPRRFCGGRRVRVCRGLADRGPRL